MQDPYVHLSLSNESQGTMCTIYCYLSKMHIMYSGIRVLEPSIFQKSECIVADVNLTQAALSVCQV